MSRPVEPSKTVESLSRRGVMRGAALGGIGVPLLAACGSDDTATPAASGDATATDPTSSAPDDSGSAGAAVAIADVPVGGGTILEDAKIVVTQPTEGDFKAFSAVCTHKGCTVNAVANGQIDCPCHKSAFSVEDGSVVNGPATEPLPPMTASVDGDNVVVS